MAATVLYAERLLFALIEALSLLPLVPPTAQVNPLLEGMNKIKDLIKELEESFRESNNVGNNLILRCVLLRAENQNLFHQIDGKKRNPYSMYNRNWQFSFANPEKLVKGLPIYSTKGIAHLSGSKTSLKQPLEWEWKDEVDVLHKTIVDLQKNLREKDKKIETLCQKYLYLKRNKSKMENDLKSKILSLEKQLDLTYDALNEFQNELDAMTGKNLSETEDVFEAMFMQEKLRCSKLMYEKVKLHHKIKRLEDSMRRQTIVMKERVEYEEIVKCSLDKSTSEPLMRHF